MSCTDINSHVRSPSIIGEVGFLAEDRRINVAVTRARRHIAVVCDTQTVQNHAFLKSLIDHMTQHGEVRTAFEYIQDIVPQNYTRDHKETKANTSASSSTKHKVKEQPPREARQGQKKPAASSRDENTADAKHKKSCATARTEEEQKKDRYTEIRQQVEQFLKDLNHNELQFPSSFNSHDRLLVHQVAEELGLVHESKGEGKDRCITVSRPLETSPAAEETQEQETEEAPEEEQVPDPQCESSSPPSLDLKSLHLERMKREQQKREENARLRKQQNSTQTTSSSKKNKSAKGWS